MNNAIGVVIENLIENCDRAAFATASDMPSADSGTYQTRSTAGIYTRATTMEARAGVSVLEAAALGPNAGAGLHAGPSGLTAYAKAEAVRAEVSAAGLTVGVGLGVNSGLSLGVDGLEVAVLGFGFSVGPRMAVKLPIADVSCIVM